MNRSFHTIDIAAAAAAGLLATVPMTIAMFGIQQMLPRRKRTRVEPRRITDDMLRHAGLRDDLAEQERNCAATLAHFGYGAAMGAAYPLVRRLPIARGLSGPGYGMLVWAASYIGWLPAIKTLPPPLRRPNGRNVLLIAAHFVWGASTEAMYECSR
jgi:uncharacterized membrane protein YagU involved in acid resistance